MVPLAIATSAAHLDSDVAERKLTKSHLKKLDKLCKTDEVTRKIFRLSDYLQNSTQHYR
jgi:hypothetical protein